MISSLPHAFPADAELEESRVVDVTPLPTFDEVYETHFPYVWQSVLHLGVRRDRVDDVVQDVFVVVHRRLPDFTRQSTVKTWLFGIVLNLVRHERRSLRRKPDSDMTNCTPELDWLVEATDRGPFDSVAKAEALETLQGLLDQLDDEKREVFILAELGQMSASQIAEITGANINTIYGRLRAAQREFENAVRRYRAREDWRAR
jgi:RNA polymerase sigma-70 factor (ECF subfamily)